VNKVAAALLCGFIHFYRYTFAALFGGQCRFTPSCSAYAIEAIKLHGPARGTRLAIRRICRCHPWGKHGFNPVPPRVK
jgi:putative membrane protein insertion efficiency factor